MRYFLTNSLTVGFAVLTLAVFLPAAATPQTRNKPVKKNAAKAAAPAPTPTPTEVVVTSSPAKGPVKKNDRGPAAQIKTADNKPVVVSGTRYSYTFDRPGFTYSRIVIEHDELGKGTIAIKPDKQDETFTDPIQLTATTLGNLKRAFEELNFLDSSESYQYSRDYPHLGNITITLAKDGRSRSAKFNWTDNAGARLLMDEYRRIGNEYTWKLEMQSARENQPLMTPGLIEAIDSYVERNEISDPGHLVPLLAELSLDERLPLLARNRIRKILAKLAKASK